MDSGTLFLGVDTCYGVEASGTLSFSGSPRSRSSTPHPTTLFDKYENATR